LLPIVARIIKLLQVLNASLLEINCCMCYEIIMIVIKMIIIIITIVL
jgi:hypothetical protein